MYQLAAMLEMFKMRLRNDEGATAVEYGLMVSLIAAVIVGAVTLIGGNLTSLFNSVAASV